MKKKTISIILSIAVLVGIFSVINFTTTPVSSKFTITSYTSKQQKFIAHRGLSSKYPENTLPAINAAIENGFYGCEFDIHTTKDGVWVLNHDTSIDKMTDGTGEISDYTYEELLKFNVDNGQGIENYKNLKLPTLAETLQAISNSDIVAFIEIKGYNTEAFADLISMIYEYNLIKRTIIISFDMEALIALRELDENITAMYVTNELTFEDVDTCEKYNFGCDVNAWLVFKMFGELKAAKALDLTLAAWTVDMPFLSDFLHLIGIDYITTNRIIP